MPCSLVLIGLTWLVAQDGSEPAQSAPPADTAELAPAPLEPPEEREAAMSRPHPSHLTPDTQTPPRGDVLVDQEGRYRILVLSMQAKGVPGAAAETVESLITVKLSEREQLNVVSRADLAAALQVEADREVLGCNDESCLAEIAGALDARLVVHGDVSSLDGQLLITVSLFDAEQARALARESVAARRLIDVAERLTPLVHNLLADLLGHERIEVAPVEDEGFTKEDIVFLGGTSVAVVGGGLIALSVVLGGMAWFGPIIGNVLTGEPSGVLLSSPPVLGPVLAVLGEEYDSGVDVILYVISFGFQVGAIAGTFFGGALLAGGIGVPFLFGGTPLVE